jgi:hypothetical protein
MGAVMAENAVTIWADGPALSPYQPEKSRIRAWGTWLEDLLHRAAGVNYAADLTTFKATDPAVVKNLMLSESGADAQGARGWFTWVDGNFSAIVTLDTTQSVAIASDDIASTAGAWIRTDYLAGKNVNLGWFRPDRTGVASANAAFAAACKVATARDNTIPAWASMPKAFDVSIEVPDGIYKLTSLVDTNNKAITWILGNAVQFASGTPGYLNGRVQRDGRTSLGTPFGSLDHATGDSVMVGGSSYDNDPLVTGLANPNLISTNDSIDLVGRYTDTTASDLLHSSAATYTALTCVLTTPVDVNKLKKGMVLQTRHSPTVYRAQIMSWDATGTTITVQGWYLFGSTTATTPSSTGSPIVDFNPFHKIWGQNTNVFLPASAYGFQAVGHEIGVWNDKATPSIAEDASGRLWGDDVVNLGPRKGSIAFVARGAFFEGYRASGAIDIGYHSSAYSSLGYVAPTVGFQHQGGGTAFRSKTAAGVTDFSVSAGLMTLGSSGGTSEIRFLNSAAPSYDSRIRSTAGTGADANGIITIDTVLTLTKTIRPSTDNSFECGGASNRWTIVFATTGTINTSDPKFKRFYDEFNKAEAKKTMTALKRAVTKLPIRPYQWLDALAEKGEEARMHIGVSAQDVVDIFKAEGLDARHFALFCEDDEFEQVEVITEIEVPEEEDQEQPAYDHEIVDGKMIVTPTIRTVKVQKFIEIPMVEPDGVTPIMVDNQEADETGKPKYYLNDQGKVKPLIKKIPAIARVRVMRKEKSVSYENKPTGQKRMGIRYDQLAMLMIAALRG